MNGDLGRWETSGDERLGVIGGLGIWKTWGDGRLLDMGYFLRRRLRDMGYLGRWDTLAYGRLQ